MSKSNLLIEMRLKGGGPLDGGRYAKFYQANKTHGNNLQEKCYGGMWFWALMVKAGKESVTFYVEQHGHERRQVMPPSTLELWHYPELSMRDDFSCKNSD